MIEMLFLTNISMIHVKYLKISIIKFIDLLINKSNRFIILASL
jgi:hypothetical protein